MKRVTYKFVGIFCVLLLCACPNVQFETINLEIEENGAFVPAKDYRFDFGQIEYNTNFSKQVVLRATNADISSFRVSWESEYFRLVSQSIKKDSITVVIANDPTVLGSHLAVLEVYKDFSLVGQIAFSATQTDEIQMPLQKFWRRVKKFEVNGSQAVLNLQEEGYDAMWETCLTSNNTIIGTNQKVITIDTKHTIASYSLATDGNLGYYSASIKSVQSGVPCQISLKSNSETIRFPFVLEDSNWHEVGILVHTSGFYLFLDDVQIGNNSIEPLDLLPITKIGIELRDVSQNHLLFIDKFGYYKM